MNKAEEEFLKGLTALSQKTGVVIGGCGCCGSPYLTEEKLHRDEGYTYPDSVAWQKKNEFTKAEWESMKYKIIK